MTDNRKGREGPQEDELIHRLFVEEYASLLRAAYYSLGDHGLAEAAVQECFLAAIRYRDKLAACEKPAGWLYRALRFAIKHLQRDRNELLAHTVPLDSVPEEKLARWDSRPVAEEFLTDDKDLQLLKDFYLNGYSIRELAERDGIGVSACKMRIKRAKERLKKF